MAFGGFKVNGLVDVNDSEFDIVDPSGDVIPAGATAVWDSPNWDVIISPAKSSATAPQNPIDNQIWVDESVSPHVAKIWREYIGNGSWLPIGVPAASRFNPVGPFVQGTDYKVGDCVTYNGGSYYCTSNTNITPEDLSANWQTIVMPSTGNPDISVYFNTTEFVLMSNAEGNYALDPLNTVVITVKKDNSSLATSTSNVPNTFICTIESVDSLTAGALARNTTDYTLAAPTVISATKTSFAIVKIVVRDKTGAGVAKTVYQRINYTLVKKALTAGEAVTGATPHFTIGSVTSSTTAAATITGTTTDPILNLVLPKGDASAVPGPKTRHFIIKPNAASARISKTNVLNINSINFDLKEITGYYSPTTWANEVEGHAVWRAVKHTYVNGVFTDVVVDLSTIIGSGCAIMLDTTMTGISVEACIGAFPVATTDVNETMASVYVPVVADGYIGSDGLLVGYEITGESDYLPCDATTKIPLQSEVRFGITKITNGVSTNPTTGGYWMVYTISELDAYTTLFSNITTNYVNIQTSTITGLSLRLDYFSGTHPNGIVTASRTVVKTLAGTVAPTVSYEIVGGTEHIDIDHATGAPLLTQMSFSITTIRNGNAQPAASVAGLTWEAWPLTATGGHTAVSLVSGSKIQDLVVVDINSLALQHGILVEAYQTIDTVTSVIASKALTLQTVNIPGPRGLIGLTGATPTFTIDRVDTLAPDSPATVLTVGTAPDYGLRLGIPRGIPGIAATIESVIAVEGNTVNVVNEGTSTAAALKFYIPPGAHGQRTAVMTLFKWGDPEAAPTLKPSGASIYTWSTASWESPTAPNGWAKTIGAVGAGQALYMCQLTLTNNTTDIVNTANWSNSTITTAGSSGPNAYIWVRYADDSVGAGMVNTPSDTKYYMGLAFNKMTAVSSNVASDYQWIRVRGVDGISTTLYSVVASATGIAKNHLNVNSPTSLRFTASSRVGNGMEFLTDSVYWTVKIDGVLANPDKYVIQRENLTGGTTGCYCDVVTGSATVNVSVTIYNDAARLMPLGSCTSIVFSAGPKGDTGAPATIESISITTGLPGTNAAVSYGGTNAARTIALTLPRGDIGITPNINIGSVTSGATAAATLTVVNPTTRNLNLVLPKGDKGDAGTIDSITVTGLAAGASPTITLGGTSSSRTMALAIPKGDPGTPPTVSINSTTTGSSGSPALVTLDATSTATAAKFNFTIPKGDKGDAATIAGVFVTTGTAGSAATVSNGGTSSAAILNFTIPRGDVGVTPNITIGSVTRSPTLASVSLASNSTPLNPKFDFVLPQGDQGPIGPSIVLNPSRGLTFSSIDGAIQGDSDIVFTATVTGIANPTYSWATLGASSAPAASYSNTYSISAANFGTAKSVVVQCTVGSFVVSAVIYRAERSTAQAGATVGADWISNLTSKPTSLSGINTTESDLLNSFSKSGGTVTLTGDFQASGNITAYQTSDKRLKENIVPIETPLVKIKALSGNTFKWEDTYYAGLDSAYIKQNDVGVIAQEVLDVVPEAVKQRADGILAVDYIRLIPLLIESIKAQQLQIEELQNALLNK
jgi:hypothetical protein